MSMLDDIMAHLERTEREQKVRDAGLLRAFEILTGAIDRNNKTLDMIHQQGADARADLAWIKDALHIIPDAIGDAINNALDYREGPYEPGDAENMVAGKDANGA